MPRPAVHAPRITIVVPSYNQGRFLGEALDSIFGQGYPDVEVIVMDGGSTDGSVDLIRTYAERLAYWQSEPDGGQAAAINAGMRRATGEVVGWLNSDDLFWGPALWTVARARLRYRQDALYIGNGIRQREDDGRERSAFTRRHLALRREALREGLDYVLQPATFFSRAAWEEAGGLRNLRYCMDWDLILRVSARHRAVLIDDQLAVSREYGATKTSTGGLDRCAEIARMIASHTGGNTTPGVTFYTLETLLYSLSEEQAARRHQLFALMSDIHSELERRFGNADGFPERGDPHDVRYLPRVDGVLPRPAPESDLPSISIVTPSFNQAPFLRRTLDSLLEQHYPRLETIVVDGGSTDGSVTVLESYGSRLTHWTSEPDRGPAHAINKGFRKATGEILAWVNSDDMLAADSLREIGEAFAADPEIDMVVANALYVDEEDELHVADHGTYRTGLYYGDVQDHPTIPAYWTYIHSVPQPTVFFRRRLLERCGPLDESYQFIFDFELFWRFVREARVRKIERTLAFYRIHAASKTTDWNKFLVELYRFSRPLWPSRRSPAFRSTLRSFLRSYRRRKLGSLTTRARWIVWAAALLAAFTGVGNPERWPPFLGIGAPSTLRPRRPA